MLSTTIKYYVYLEKRDARARQNLQNFKLKHNIKIEIEKRRTVFLLKTSINSSS